MSPSQLEIYRLGLVGDCAEFARALSKMYPGVEFTSGRRTRESHAWAMAQNIVIGGRKWIAKTYKASPVSKALQRWLDVNPQATTAHDISEGLLGLLNGYTDEQLEALSLHFSGRAVDIQPLDGPDAAGLLMSIRTLVQQFGGRFIEREGGLRRWHCQFRK